MKKIFNDLIQTSDTTAPSPGIVRQLVGPDGKVYIRTSVNPIDLEWKDSQVRSNLQSAVIEYQLLLSDTGKVIDMEHATWNNVTIPADGTVNFMTDTVMYIHRYGVGVTTITADPTVTLNGELGGIALLSEQYCKFGIRKLGVNEWQVFGCCHNCVGTYDFMGLDWSNGQTRTIDGAYINYPYPASYAFHIEGWATSAGFDNILMVATESVGALTPTPVVYYSAEAVYARGGVASPTFQQLPLFSLSQFAIATAYGTNYYGGVTNVTPKATQFIAGLPLDWVSTNITLSNGVTISWAKTPAANTLDVTLSW